MAVWAYAMVFCSHLEDIKAFIPLPLENFMAFPCTEVALELQAQVSISSTHPFTQPSSSPHPSLYHLILPRAYVSTECI